MWSVVYPQLSVILFVLGLSAVSFASCYALIKAQAHFDHLFSRRDDLRAVQAFHVRHAPRVGGVGVLVAMLFVLLFLVPDRHSPFFAAFAVTLLPVFAAGLAEDLGWRVNARGRLLAAATSSLLAVFMLRIWLMPMGLPVVDHLLSFTPVAIIVTVFWATGICHAMNLIDGVNGLAGSVALLIAAGLAIVAHQADASAFALVATAMIPALFGFLLLNWPYGRIFLGDAGAYTLGHILVWLAIGLAWYHPQVSAVALTLMFFWPVADTLLAISRRLSRGKAVGEPDRLHFHQFVMRGLMLLSDGRIQKGTANSLTVVILLPLIAAPIGTAVYFWDRPFGAFAAWVIYIVLFATTYLVGIRVFRQNHLRRFVRKIFSTR